MTRVSDRRIHNVEVEFLAHFEESDRLSEWVSEDGVLLVTSATYSVSALLTDYAPVSDADYIVNPKRSNHIINFFTSPLIGQHRLTWLSYSSRFRLFAVVVLASQQSSLAMKNIVLRPAWGVSFACVSGLQAGFSHWTHSFVVEFPKIDIHFQPPPAQCQLGRDGDVYRQFINQNGEIFGTHSRAIQQAEVDLEVLQLIPGTPVKTRTRVKRGFLDLGGQIFSSLFGVATDASVVKVKQHIALVARGVKTDCVCHERVCYDCVCYEAPLVL